MAKPPCKDLYQVRTLAYYLAKGGIYNDLITYLTQLRRQPQHRGMASLLRCLTKRVIILIAAKHSLPKRLPLILPSCRKSSAISSSVCKRKKSSKHR